MIIEVKVKVARIIDGKTRKRAETFITDCELFAQAEYAVMNALSNDQSQGIVDNFEIQSIRISPIKEIYHQFTGESNFIATLKDIFHADDGTEKTLKYKILLWANSPQEALTNTVSLARQGYDMQIEGIKEVNYEYVISIQDE